MRQYHLSSFKNYYSISLILLIITIIANAGPKEPDWATNWGKSYRYTDLMYLTGFGQVLLSADMDQVTAMQKADEIARGNLSEKLLVRIESSVSSMTEETSTDFSTYFSSVIQSKSSLEVQGLNSEEYYCKKKKTAYVLIYVRRDAVEKHYSDKATRLRNNIRTHISKGLKCEEAGDRTRALEEYFVCQPLLRELEEAQTIRTASQSSIDKAFTKLGGKISSDAMLNTQVEHSINKIVQKPITNIDDLTWYLAYIIKEQTGNKEVILLVKPFTFEDTRMNSEFSRYFQILLENQIVEVAKWQVVQPADNITPTGTNVEQDFLKASGAAYVLTGTYWEQSDQIKLIANLRGINDNKIIASIQTKADTTVFTETKRSLKPSNFTNAFKDQTAFRYNMEVGSGLNLDVWTNKGEDNLIFTEGEIMKIYVRVNIPSYIRVIYHLADGMRTPLCTSHYIDESNVNMPVLIPSEFECAPPFGAEVLQVFARTHEFEPVDTVSYQGYPILREDLSEFLANIRGMKKRRKEDMEIIQTEHRIVISTMTQQ
ncbi:MAG: hypothetical protein P9X24_12750 [Candidatus Hatepunaea meridiana]|nr:hypothetical protein [Candidatus Hatepunaea meridiana]